METCVYESIQGSATAVIGSDRINFTEAVYSFKFRSFNKYPNKAGFRLTSDVDWVTGTYRLTCKGGCTAPNIVLSPVFSANGAGMTRNVMTFVDVFGSVVEAGTLIEVEITDFTNPSFETILNVFYEVIHTSTEVSPVNYQIYKF